MRRCLGAIALVIVTAGGSGVAHAKDRVLYSGAAKAIADGAGVKAKAACNVTITTADPDPCPVTCQAAVTCGATTFTLADASCAPTPGLDLACKDAYRKRLFAAQGGNGEIDVGDGYALVGDDDQVVAATFTGGRAAGDPEGKPKTRLRETRALTFEGGVTMPVKACTVELATYPDRHVFDPCQMKCVAKVTCGPLRVTRVGSCEIPYFYTANEGKCYGEVVALTFDDANGAQISIGERDEDKSEGTFPLSVIGTLTLAK